MVDMDKIQPSALTTQLKCRPTNFAIWHRCLAHAGTDTICQIISKRLVDRLDMSGETLIGGLCKDCIYGKHTAHPYHKNKSKESAVLEHVHIDIWRPCQIQSAGGAMYFMIIMDSFSSYRTVTFLKHKSAETMLKIFKNFQIKAECQTGKWLKHIRLDMEKEWHNNTWEDYRMEQGLIFEFTMPYVH